MKKKSDANVRARRTTVYVSLAFLILAVSLQALVWLYWQKILEPRLRREAAAQANVLAHSQEVRLANAILGQTGQRLKGLRETIDEILLFKGPSSDEPLFLGIDLEIDYDVVAAQKGSLDLNIGKQCPGCFLSEVGLYSPISDELIGIARFHVSDRLFRNLSSDVHKTLFTQSRFVILLLTLVWGVVMYLIREINHSRQQAEAANRSKSAFLANMSHELRTPLNAIIGFSELMGFDTDIPEKHRKNLAIIHRSGEYLLELINDVLELSKIEAARETLTETTVDLYDTLEKVLEMIRLRAEKKNLQLAFERADEVPRFIKTDERKLRQILLNLLGNAVKFTKEGGVTLRVRSETGKGQDDLCLKFEVEDSGPGIAQEERAGIFEAFAQTSVGYDKMEGTGLGLAISRQFVHHLGGEIQVGGAEGNGAVFRFTILARRAASMEMRSPQSSRRVTGIAADRGLTHRILVVDDNAENRALLKMLLERVGFMVQTAQNGQQAVELNETWKPHLIWMDMRMPVMDGYEATRTIQRMAVDKGKTAPVIIALTASAFDEDRDAVLAAGCDDFVRRPFRESEIFHKIEEYLDVTFSYEALSPVASRSSSSNGWSAEHVRSAIADLPRSTVIELRTAIELSDMDRMERIVNGIADSHGALANELKPLVESFQFDRLLGFLDGTANVISERREEK